MINELIYARGKLVCDKIDISKELEQKYEIEN